MPYFRYFQGHVWDNYMEMCEDIHYTEGMKELYSHRKETIEKIFGTAKETMDSDTHRCMVKRG